MKYSRIIKFIILIAIVVLITACTDSVGTEKKAPDESEITIVELQSDSEISDAPSKEAEMSEYGNSEIELDSLSSNFIEVEDNAAATFSDEENQTVTITMVGDILLHDGVEKCARKDDGTYDYSQIFKNVKSDIENADLAIVNQEVIIGGAELGISGYPSFNAPYEIADALADTGFDVVCHATNHALDKGGRGITNCTSYWKMNQPKMSIVGIHDSQDDQADVRIVDVKGIKIAILNYTYGTNGVSLPASMPFAVDLLNENQVRADIEKASNLADFVVVCPHWGTEYRLTPDSYQEKWTKILFEAGADLVIGTHPHVIEPVEMITDEESEKQMLVYYSLGNFVNWTSGKGDKVANRVIGGMATVTISEDTNHKIVISDYGIVALVTDLHNCADGVTTYKLSDYTENQAQANEIKYQDPNFSLKYCTQLCDEVWGDLWH